MEGIKAVGPILETHELDRFQDIHDILYPHLKRVRWIGSDLCFCSGCRSFWVFTVCEIQCFQNWVVHHLLVLLTILLSA